MDDLIETASRRPLQAEKRVFILKDAQCLNEMAANSFLKTLEEPLPTNVFILLAANLNLILPTIQSRCQILKFLPLSKNEIRLELQQRGVDPEKSRLLAFFSSDSLENVSEVGLAGAGGKAPGHALHPGPAAAPERRSKTSCSTCTTAAAAAKASSPISAKWSI